MKKKILGVLIVIILIITLIGLAGCRSKEENSANTENSEAKQNESDTQKENQEGIVVTNVYAASDKYAVVVADNKTYIINNNGEKQGTVDFEISEGATITINNNGYVYYGSSYDSNRILDKSGKVIYENNNDTMYNYITEDNYTLRTSTKSDFENGESKQKEIIDMSGNVIKELEGETSYYYLGGSIWYCDGNEKSLYNEKTGDVVVTDNYNIYYNNLRSYAGGFDSNVKYKNIENGGTFINSLYITSDLKCEDNSNKKYITDEYYYNIEDYSIYKYDGSKVKELTSGKGYENIYFGEDKYYVQSGTGFFYVLDEEFNQIEEPYELGELKGTTEVVGNNCILNKEKEKFTDGGYEGTWDHFYLYDYKGNLIEDLAEGWNGVSQISNNIIRLDRMSDTGFSESSGSIGTTYIGSQTTDKYINLYTGTTLKVY